MYKRIEKGIRQSSSGMYEISIDLPPTENKNKWNCYHIGSVKTLDEAREVRRKAEEYRYFNGGDCLEELEELKKSIFKKKLTKKDAVVALNRLLDDHDRIYGEYTLFDNDPDGCWTEDDIQRWKDERAALVMAIKMLKKRR